MGLRAKFNLTMLAAFIIGLGLAAAISWRVINDAAREEVIEEARIIAAEAAAVRDYTVKEIEPLLAAQSRNRFLPHTIPAFAAVTTQREFSRRFPNYTYREAALNPTNPADKATPEEAAVIERFRQDPGLNTLITTRDTPAGQTLSIASPEKIQNKECLVCHSTPDAAPASMIDIYGPQGGFGWQVNETVGAQIVSVPMDVARDGAKATFFTFLGGVSAVFALSLLLLNVLLHFMVIRPITAISRRATEVSTGGAGGEEFEVKGSDEVASLAQSFNRMSRSLATAMKMLDS
jgi:protein-histidine pros-kinase